MQTQRVNLNDPEKITLVVKNVDGGGVITTGLGVTLQNNSIDGIAAVQVTAALIKGFAGVAQQDIAINGFGKCVVWGLANSVQISHVGTSITITKGDVLKPGAVAGTFFSSITDQALSTLIYRYIIAATTPVAVSTKAQSFVKGFVKAL